MAQGERLVIPIFPLHSVLFPGGPLALRIFESRYLDMVSRCLKEDSGFGVALIQDGEEVGQAAIPHRVGTLGKISYWHRRNDGLLGITVRGERRFRILSTEVGEDRLLRAEVELLPPEPVVVVMERYEHLVVLLDSILEQLDHPYVTLERHYGDANWVASRLVELLPMPLHRKQLLLEEDDPLRRLECLHSQIIDGRITE